MLRDAMALTLAGDYAPFPTVARGALQVVAGGSLDDDQLSHVIDAFGQLPAQPDAEPALQRLVDAPVMCLSNGLRQSTEALLGRSGLGRFVDDIVSIDDVEQWKPAPQVHRRALDQAGRTPRQVALVAVHAFDCHGAHAAGLTTGWAPRLEHHYAEVFAPADVVGEDLVTVIDGLLAVPPRPE